MENPGKDIVEVVRLLLAGSAAERQRVIDTCFTPDVEFEHPLLWLKGRSELLALYQYHSDLNYRIDFDIPKFVVSEGRDRIVLDFDQFLHPLPLLGLTVLLRLIVFLDLKKTPQGFKICRQEDHILWLESARKNVPFLNYYYERYVRRATGLAIVYTMAACGVVARFVHTQVLPQVPWVKNSTQVKAKVHKIHQWLDPRKLEEWLQSEKGLK